jgi:hypothetical protein
MLIGQQTPVQQTQVPASPKQEEPAEDLIFRGGVNYVSTPALVLDRDGNYVNGLEQKTSACTTTVSCRTSPWM